MQTHTQDDLLEQAEPEMALDSDFDGCLRCA